MPDLQFARDLERRLFGLDVRPFDDAVVFGSTVMKLHGMKDEVGDIDLFVTPRAYARLRDSKYWEELRPDDYDPPYLEALNGWAFHAFYAWQSRDTWLDVPDAMATAERVEGIMHVRLELVASWKYQALVWCWENDVQVEGSPWEKHITDLFTLQHHGVNVPEIDAAAAARGWVAP